MTGTNDITSTRFGFVATVAQAFEDAGVSHVFLHDVGHEPSRDSDVDVAVARESLAAVDTIVRTGRLGRLLQRFDYDVPWCRFYVIETGDPDRRFRQLDVACDPFGIGRYGDAMRLALEHAQGVDGLSALEPAATVAYLAAKRARKGIRDAADVRELRTTFEADPAGASALLRAAFGDHGATLGDALEAGLDPGPALREIGRLIEARRRTPRRLALRTVFGAARVARRVVRPTGLLVSVVGPDGTGKTTLADGLESAANGLFRGTRRLHLSPGVLPPPGRLLGRRGTGDTSEPHARPPSTPAGSIARIGYLAADTVIGWLPTVSRARARATLVVLERGWEDLAVDPRRYRLSAGAKLIRLGARVLPRPDVTLLLEAPAEEIHARKPELDVAEIDRQLAAWRRVAQDAAPGRYASVNAPTPEDARGVALEIVEDRLAGRLGDLGRFATTFSCLGQPSASGKSFVVVSGRGHPRWIVPRRLGAAGPVGTKLYRPGTFMHRLGAGALEAASRAGLPVGTSLALDTSDGLGPELAAALGLDDVELAALLSTDTHRRSRTVLTVLHRGRAVAVAKVAQQGSQELETELRALYALEAAPVRAIVTPRVLASFPWRGLDVVAMTVLSHRGRTSRSLGPVEGDALVELSELTDRLKPAVQDADGRVLAHGDFCGWNTSVLRDGRLAVWDWEWAHLGEPLEDWFHWETQRLVAFRALSIEELVGQALDPRPELRRLCERLGLDAASEAPASLRASLRHGIARLSSRSHGRELDVRAQALELLEGQ